MRFVFFILCLTALSAKGQHEITCGKGLSVVRDTAVFFISNETPSNWWRHVDHNPFPRVLIRVYQPGGYTTYLKKLKHGWSPLPPYYKIWNN